MSRKFDSSAFHDLPEEEEVSDLMEDPELEALLQQASDEQSAAQQAAEAAQQQEQAQSPEEALKIDILKVLATNPQRPSDEQISQWKKKFGDESITVTAFDKQNVFVYSYITLADWEAINAFAEKARGTSVASQLERTLKEKIVRKALLWPQVNEKFFKEARAGLLDALYNGVMLQSYMLQPQQVLMLSTKL